MKIAVGMIVYNSDFVLKQAIESVLPFVDKVCIAEGAVEWWRKNPPQRTDDTTRILNDQLSNNKIIIMRGGVFPEKTEQSQAWFSMIPTDTDYILCVDADEVHKPEHLESLIKFLEKEQPTSVGFKSDTFFGGFDHIIGGFEAQHSFKRVLKYIPGCEYFSHRQPTLSVNGNPIEGNDITGQQLYEATGITMPHYSYVSPQMVHDKIEYYRNAVIAPGKCIPNYFEDVFLRWVQHPEEREAIEKKWNGVQEFTTDARGECFTQPFTGEHPEIIKRDMEQLKEKFNNQLKLYNGDNVQQPTGG